MVSAIPSNATGPLLNHASNGSCQFRRGWLDHPRPAELSEKSSLLALGLQQSAPPPATSVLQLPTEMLDMIAKANDRSQDAIVHFDCFMADNTALYAINQRRSGRESSPAHARQLDDRQDGAWRPSRAEVVERTAKNELVDAALALPTINKGQCPGRADPGLDSISSPLQAKLNIATLYIPNENLVTAPVGLTSKVRRIAAVMTQTPDVDRACLQGHGIIRPQSLRLSAYSI